MCDRCSLPLWDTSSHVAEQDMQLGTIICILLSRHQAALDSIRPKEARGEQATLPVSRWRRILNVIGL
jgi:hypothetical protein